MKRLILLIAVVASQNVCASHEVELVAAAHERTKHSVRYDGAYVAIAYPNGDVPKNQGVCTDVVIRSYRAVGTDLQKLLHEDMSDNFSAYPAKRIWNQNSPDKNIDHRRVPNLRAFFKRKGVDFGVSHDKTVYRPGDIVTWSIPGNLPHIGIVSDQKSGQTGNPLIIHNIGEGPKIEDMLFNYTITGHYKYVP